MMMILLSWMMRDVDGSRCGWEHRQLRLVSAGVQLQLKVGSGGLDEHSLQHVRINRLQEDRVSQDCLQQGRINAGKVVFVNSVTGPVL